MSCARLLSAVMAISLIQVDAYGTETGQASAAMVSSATQNGYVGRLNNIEWAIYTCLGPLLLADVDDNECVASGYWYQGTLYALESLGISECKPIETFYKKIFDVFHREKLLGTITRRGLNQDSFGHCIFGDGVDLKAELGLDPRKYSDQLSTLSLRNFRLGGEFVNYDVEAKIRELNATR